MPLLFTITFIFTYSKPNLIVLQWEIDEQLRPAAINHFQFQVVIYMYLRGAIFTGLFLAGHLASRTSSIATNASRAKPRFASNTIRICF